MNEPAALATSGEGARKTRRPYLWREPQVPSLADLFAGGERRDRFLAYWRKDGPLDLMDELLFPVFRSLPLRFSSWLGGRIARFLARRKYAKAFQRVCGNLAMIRPDLDDAAREALALSHFDNAGRVLAEFPLLSRLGPAGRLLHESGGLLPRLHAEGPVILLGVHTANWEIMAPIFTSLGAPVTLDYKPPRRAGQLRIAVRVRQSLGLKLLPPGMAGARPALRLLQAGECLCIYGDEEHDGRIQAPFFGRPPHLNGNLAIAARLARMTGAKILAFHGERRPGGRYAFVFEGPVVLPSQADPAAPLLDDVIALNAVIEPVVRAHCGSWWFLDGRFD